MVGAARLALLSLAATASCMYGAFRGEPPRAGRLERRLALLAGDEQDVGISEPGPESDPEKRAEASPLPLLSTWPREVANSYQADAAVVVPQAVEQASSSTSSSSLPVSSEMEYTYPPEFATGEAGTTDFQGPTNTLEPTRGSALPSDVKPPETIGGAVKGNNKTLTSSAAAAAPPSSSPVFSATVTRDGAPQFTPIGGQETNISATTPTITSVTSKALPITGTGMGEQEVSPTSDPDTLPWDYVPPPYEPPWEQMGVPSDVAAGWSSTRTAKKDWGYWSTTTTEYINTWTDVPWTGGWVTITGSSEPMMTAASYCQASDLLKPSTTYSIVHTTTITWTGDPKDYTAPFPPLTTPTPSCEPSPTAGAADDDKSPMRLTMSRCTSTGTLPQYRTCEVTTTTMYRASTTSTTGAAVSSEAGMAGPAGVPLAIVTHTVTDKNPAVVFPGMSTPDYGAGSGNQHGGGGATALQNTKEAQTVAGPAPTANQNNKQSAGSGPEYGPSPAPAPITLSVHPGSVIINGHTITDSPVMRTQVINIDGEAFTINPSQVIGAGATVARPPSGGSGPAVFAPTTTIIGGVPIYLSSRVAVIDGTTFSLDGAATTKVVPGPGSKTVTINKDGVTVGSETARPTPAGAAKGGGGLPPTTTSPPPQTEVVVAGGELVTAIGRSVLVIHDTTITYGIQNQNQNQQQQTLQTVVVNGEAITLSPQGVLIHGTLLGGPNARPTDTQYAIVGGATITQVAPSLVIISGMTYTIGPSAPAAAAGATPTTTTLVVGGETVTIGPDGVVVATLLSFAFPLGGGMTFGSFGTGGPGGATMMSAAAGGGASAGAVAGGGGGGGGGGSYVSATTITPKGGGGAGSTGVGGGDGEGGEVQDKEDGGAGGSRAGDSLWALVLCSCVALAVALL